MNTAIYPGSFDPVTLGHIDIIRRCRSFIDQLYIAIGHNDEKKSLFPVTDRRRMIHEALEAENLDRSAPTRIEVDDFDGLLINYARQKKANLIVRGIRAFADFEYEFQMASMNRKLDAGIVTLFITTSDQYHFVSSRLVKEIAANHGDISSFVAAPTKRELQLCFAPLAAGRN